MLAVVEIRVRAPRGLTFRVCSKASEQQEDKLDAEPIPRLEIKYRNTIPVWSIQNASQEKCLLFLRAKQNDARYDCNRAQQTNGSASQVSQVSAKLMEGG